MKNLLFTLSSLEVALFAVFISVIFSLLILYDYPFSGPEAVFVGPFKSLLDGYLPMP